MKLKTFFLIALVAVMSLGIFVACGPDGTGDGSSYTVTFDLNYSGAPSATTVKVEEDDGVFMVDEPTAPTRTNYVFAGWFTDAACTNPVDFENDLTSDVTYYASWTQTVAIITYNANYTGSSSQTASVNIGSKATQPTAPTRNGYLFDGWYTDSACSTAFSLDTAISGDIILYAKWEESAGDTVTVTFKYNYGTAGDYYSQTLNTGRRVSKPADPTGNDGYAFTGWYTDAACTTEYDFNAFVTVNTDIYACWKKINSFEFEYVDLTGMNGAGWSASVTGIGLIDEDDTASGGFYVGYMYVTGNTLTFHITAEEAATDCSLVLRLTAEGEEGSVVSLTDEELLVKVNGTALDYSTLIFDEIPDITGGDRRDFTNHLISTSVSLNAGENVIQFVVNNEKSMGGTMSATAPMFDCMYIYTNTEIDWTEGKCYSDNIKGM